MELSPKNIIIGAYPWLNCPFASIDFHGRVFSFFLPPAGSTRRKDALKALVRLGFAEKGRRSLDVRDTSWRFWKWVYLKVSLSLRQGQSRVRSRPWTLQKQGACEFNAFSSYIGHGAAHATDGGA